MNNKAQAFSDFLTNNKIEAFQVQEVPDDAQGTVVFRSALEIEGQRLSTLACQSAAQRRTSWLSCAS